MRTLRQENTLARGFLVGASTVYAGSGVFMDAWTERIRWHAKCTSECPRVCAGACVFFGVWGGEYGEKAVP